MGGLWMTKFCLCSHRSNFNPSLPLMCDSCVSPGVGRWRLQCETSAVLVWAWGLEGRPLTAPSLPASWLG